MNSYEKAMKSNEPRDKKTMKRNEKTMNTDEKQWKRYEKQWTATESKAMRATNAKQCNSHNMKEVYLMGESYARD